MKLHSWLSVGSIAALAMAVVTATAQETPPPAQEPTKKTEEPEEKTIPVKFNKLTVGYTSQKTNDWLSRYARPSSGLVLHELQLFTPGSDSWPYSRLTIRGTTGQDSYASGYVVLNHGHTVVRGSKKDYGFYVFDWRNVDRSQENETEVAVDHSFTPNIGGFFKYNAKERKGEYPVPRDRDKTRTRTFSGGVQGDVLGGNLGVTYSDRVLNDLSGNQPTTLQRSIDATYSHDFSDTFSLAGSAGYTRIEQAGLASSSVRSYALSGMFNLGPTTGIQFHLGRQDYDLASILNARIQKRLVTSARLMQRLGTWNLQFGVKHLETERIRYDQSYVDVPKVNFYDARLAGRIGGARVTLRGTWEDLTETAAMNTLDPRQLLWDDKAMFQTKIDVGNEVYSAYGAFTYKFQQNRQRGVEIDWNNFVIGGSYIFNDSLNAYAEFSTDNFMVQGGEGSGESLDLFFPNSRSIAFGLNWAKDQNLSASAALNYYNSADVRGTQLTFSVRRHFGADHDLELVIAPWRHEDKLFNITGYRNTFLSARYTVRF